MNSHAGTRGFEKCVFHAPPPPPPPEYLVERHELISKMTAEIHLFLSGLVFDKKMGSVRDPMDHIVIGSRQTVGAKRKKHNMLQLTFC